MTIDADHQGVSVLSKTRELAERAGDEVMELLKEPLVHSRKADHSLVTNADHAANKILVEGLTKLFPQDAVLSEESGLSGDPGSDYVWVIDPLDGTKAYAKGIPGFSIMVGLLHREKPVLGVVVDPMEGFVYEAAQGQGAYCTQGGQQKSLHVSERNEWAAMPIITSRGFPDSLRQSLVREHFSFVDPINSVGIKVGAVVRQRADVYINHHPVHYWDTCAPQAILEEAGGAFTYWDGSAFAYSLKEGAYRLDGPTLASNGPRHGDLVALLQSSRRGG